MQLIRIINMCQPLETITFSSEINGDIIYKRKNKMYVRLRGGQ